MTTEKGIVRNKSVCSSEVILDTEVGVTHIVREKPLEKWQRNYEPSQELIEKYFPVRVCFYMVIVAIILSLLGTFIYGIMTSEKTHITYVDLCKTGFCVEINLTSMHMLAEERNRIMQTYKKSGVETLVIKMSDLDHLDDTQLDYVTKMISYGRYLGLSVALSMNNLMVAGNSHDFGYNNNDLVCTKNNSTFLDQNEQLRFTSNSRVKAYIVRKLMRYSKLMFSFYMFDAFPVLFSSIDCSQFSFYNKESTKYVMETIKEHNPTALFGGRYLDGSYPKEKLDSSFSAIKVRIFDKVPSDKLTNSKVAQMITMLLSKLDQDSRSIVYMDHASVSPSSVAVAAFVSPTFLYAAGDETNSLSSSKEYYENITKFLNVGTSTTSFLTNVFEYKNNKGYFNCTVSDRTTYLVFYQYDSNKDVKRIMLADFDGSYTKISLTNEIPQGKKCKVIFANTETATNQDCNNISLLAHGIALIEFY